ncbi:MAG: DUF3667 domain-containing protein [Caulobacteraceae bacterium]|nr:DUF3667 domain-containing protein [Caulobacteraceae bacterium]
MDRNLEIATAASLGGLASRRVGRPAEAGEPCANCGTPLAGAYCHACGQLAEDFERSIGALLAEAFENLFHADGRLFRTLPRLVLDPAGLTRDYLAGHRASQMPPLRLFLVVVLLFFLAGNIRDLAEPSPTAIRTVVLPMPPLSAQIDRRARTIAAWFRPRLQYASTHQREIGMAMDSWLHRIAIVLLPLSTAFLSLLFVFRRRVFVYDHAIFAMHSLAFMGLLFTLIALLGLAPPLRGPVAWLALAVPIHLFVQMRGVYRTGVIGTLLRMALLFGLSVIALIALLTAVVAFELNGMGTAP